MNKQLLYQELVNRRKKCRRCSHLGYTNPSLTKYDIDHIGPYSHWAHDLDAGILIVGQDFADINSYYKFEGTVQQDAIQNLDQIKEYDTKTNFNLRILTGQLGFELNDPHEGNASGLFLTNVVLCLKPGKMNTSLGNKATANCSQMFLGPLIQLIKPIKIISLGQPATMALIKLFFFDTPELYKYKDWSFEKIFKEKKISLTADIALFPVYHPSPLGVANRKKIAAGSDVGGLDLMIEDWRKIGVS